MATKFKLSPFVPTEHDEQAIVVEWANSMVQWKKWPELAGLYAIPNGGYELAGGVAQRARIAAKLRSEGLRVGFPDLCLPIARRGFNALYIEMKSTRKGAERTQEQKDWIAWLTEQGNRAVFCFGHKEAIAELTWYVTYGGDEPPQANPMRAR